ncbi:DUF6578 domain-containing protein [Streptomyces sp. NPDC051896]|uniref:DUF6578 domain-containing protein n=1 Tax=Streptomyces sp. NPDC051896 TaxID=3155416 RepID=UPI0034459D11
MPRMRVFYEDWQMECCGTPFAVGDEVSWKLVAYDAEAVREGRGYGAEAWVENHGGPDEATVGRVWAIDLVHQEYLAHTDQRAEAVGTCPKWFESQEPGRDPGAHRIRRTRGALVTLDVPDGTPPQPGDHG